MQFWTGTAFMNATEAVAVAPMLDEAGFDGICSSDHLIYPRELKSAYPSPSGRPGWSPDTAWPDSWVLIGAMAAVTRRLRFSNAVYVAPARPLLEVAKQVATASVVSEGRVSLAVGVGWMREEYELLGQDFGNRGKRLDEMIPALRALWRGGWVSWSGQYYRVPEMMIEPHPTVAVPILCGGESDARAAARGKHLRRLGGVRVQMGRGGQVRREADGATPRVRAANRAVRDHARVARTADTRSVQACRRHRNHRGDVQSVGGARRHPSRRPRLAQAGRRALPRSDRVVRRPHHREVTVTMVGVRGPVLPYDGVCGFCNGAVRTTGRPLLRLITGQTPPNTAAIVTGCPKNTGTPELTNQR